MPAPPQPQIIEDLRFLHPPWEWWRSWPAWLAIACAIAALALVARWCLRALARARARAARLAPCRIALRALRALLARWDDARPDLFALELSAILRKYLEAMGAGPCSKLTAAEFIALLPNFELLEHDDRSWLAATASRCEPTKWAGQSMTRDEASRLVGEGASAVQTITDRREARFEHAARAAGSEKKPDPDSFGYANLEADAMKRGGGP